MLTQFKKTKRKIYIKISPFIHSYCRGLLGGKVKSAELVINELSELIEQNGKFK
jgi:hypothetical protein